MKLDQRIIRSNDDILSFYPEVQRRDEDNYQLEIEIPHGPSFLILLEYSGTRKEFLEIQTKALSECRIIDRFMDWFTFVFGDNSSS